MTEKQTLILCVISAFIESDGYAHFIYENLNPISKNEFFKTGIKELNDLSFIDDVSSNGYAKKIKVNKILQCPDFIWNEKISTHLKEYLIRLYFEYKDHSRFLSPDVKKDIKLKVLGYNTLDIIKNTKCVTKKITSGAELTYTSKGYRLNTRSETLNHKCQYCGTTNPNDFYKTGKTVCKKCIRSIDRNLVPAEERLYKRSKDAARKLKIEFNLDVPYIKSLLEKQKYKCIYSNIQFGDSFADKLTYPTIDKIDPKKGYTKGNVCICTYAANWMKSDLSIDDFKSIITSIHNTINC